MSLDMWTIFISAFVNAATVAQATAIVAGIVLVGNTLVCAQAPSPSGQRLRLVPQNEAARAPGFAPVIAKFEAAVRRRDVETIVAMMWERIAISLGSDVLGPAAFRKHWNMDSPRSEFWTVAEELLANGSALDGDCDKAKRGCYVTYPYWFARFPDDKSADRRDNPIARPNVPLLVEPRAGAAVVERLSYDVVRRVDDQSKPLDPVWENVVLVDGRRGFVRREDLFDPAFGLRMIFTRVNSQWVLSAFIKGDY